MRKLLLRIVLLAVSIIILFSIYIGLFGWNISSAPYWPPSPPEAIGVLSPNGNDRLASAEVIADGVIKRGEDIALDKQGRLYSGSNEDGKIYRVTFTESGPRAEVFADVGLIPIGMVFDKDDNLIVCHVPKGLISISPDGRQTVLTDSVDGSPFGFIDDVDVAPDGKIYFSDASTKFTGREGNLGWEYEMMDSRPYGRLLVFDPETKTTKVLLKDLYFANGVAVSPDGEYVLVNETFRARIVRYSLKGETADSHYWAENLPGYPDGILKDGRGGFWVAMPAKRETSVESILPFPFIKNIITALPKWMWVRPARYGYVARIEDGKISETLQDPSGTVFSVTNAVERDGYLYLGTLQGASLWRIKL